MNIIKIGTQLVSMDHIVRVYDRQPNPAVWIELTGGITAYPARGLTVDQIGKFFAGYHNEVMYIDRYTYITTKQHIDALSTARAKLERQLNAAPPSYDEVENKTTESDTKTGDVPGFPFTRVNDDY